METQIQKFTLATTILLLSLVPVKTPPANAGVLFTGKYASLEKKLKLISMMQREQKLANLSQGNEVLIAATETNTTSQKNKLISSSIVRRNTDLDFSSELEKSLAQSVDNLQSAEELKVEIEEVTSDFVENPNSVTEQLENLPDANRINQDLQDRYLGLLEEDTETIGLIEAQKILKSHDNDIGAEFNSGDVREVNEQELEQAVALLQNKGVIGESISLTEESDAGYQPLIVGLFLILGLSIVSRTTPAFKIVIQAINSNLIEKIIDKLGNPKVPEAQILLHRKFFRELKTLAIKTQKADDEKFTNNEFKLFIKIKHAVQKGTDKYQEICQSIELLEVAVAAQSSFLRIEQIESKYFSYHQQQFYQFVADTITENLDKNLFKDKVKKKLAEIIPLLHTDEGRDALQSYLNEVNKISKHRLGLKLISMFKKDNNNNFAILRDVSKIINLAVALGLYSPQKLEILFAEHYEVFEKISPIIALRQDKHSPETYGLILQYMGLLSKHQDSYEKFKQLIKILQKWKKPYELIIKIREEHAPNKYRLPKDFKQEIPGLNVYKKYERYVGSL